MTKIVLGWVGLLDKDRQEVIDPRYERVKLVQGASSVTFKGPCQWPVLHYTALFSTPHGGSALQITPLEKPSAPDFSGDTCVLF